MKSNPYRSRRSRELGDALKKAGIWIFLALFLFSVVGVTLIASVASR